MNEIKILMDVYPDLFRYVNGELYFADPCICDHPLFISYYDTRTIYTEDFVITTHMNDDSFVVMDIALTKQRDYEYLIDGYITFERKHVMPDASYIALFDRGIVLRRMIDGDLISGTVDQAEYENFNEVLIRRRFNIQNIIEHE